MKLLLGTACSNLSVSDLEDSLEHNICSTQAMWTQTTAEMSNLQEDPTQQASQADQVANLQEKDHQLVEIM